MVSGRGPFLFLWLPLLAKMNVIMESRNQILTEVSKGGCNQILTEVSSGEGGVRVVREGR